MDVHVQSHDSKLQNTKSIQNKALYLFSTRLLPKAGERASIDPAEVPQSVWVSLNASAAGFSLPVSRCGGSVKFQINSQTEQTQPPSAPRLLGSFGRAPGSHHLVSGGNLRPKLKDLRVLCGSSVHHCITGLPAWRNTHEEDQETSQTLSHWPWSSQGLVPVPLHRRGRVCSTRRCFGALAFTSPRCL